MNDCEELEKKRLICCRRDDDGISYRIPYAVNGSLRKNNEYIPENIENLSIAAEQLEASNCLKTLLKNVKIRMKML